MVKTGAGKINRYFYLDGYLRTSVGFEHVFVNGKIVRERNPEAEDYVVSDEVRRNININGILNDMERGVKTFSEDSYAKFSGGVTMYSLMFASALAFILDKDGLRGKSFNIRETKAGYVLHIETNSGYTLTFRGVSCGYYGEGSRGAVDILLLCQFPEHAVKRVFQNKAVKYTRRV